MIGSSTFTFSAAVAESGVDQTMSILRNILAVVIGLLAGRCLNLALVTLGPHVIPAPLWYMVLDLVGAYIPMAWIGIQLGRRFIGEASGAKT